MHDFILLKVNLKKAIKAFGTDKNITQWFCPGRVNLIGEHIDYNGGWVLPTAISLGIYGYFRINNSLSIRLFSSKFKEIIVHEISQPIIFKKENAWANYVLGCVDFLQKKGIEIEGFDLYIDSDLPVGSGLSSSAALEVLTLTILQSIFTTEPIDYKQLALDAQTIENDFICVRCGIMDQFVVANGKKNQAIRLDCQSLDFDYVPFETGIYKLIIINTNQPRTLASSAYNERRESCEKALEIISDHSWVDNLCSIEESDLELLEDENLIKVARHCMSEHLRVISALNALKHNDILKFGKLLKESHLSLRNDYNVTGEALDCVFDLATAHPSCIGARMTGAGFGGCAIALVENNKVDEFCKMLNDAWPKKYKKKLSFYPCNSVQGVHKIIPETIQLSLMF